jgi:predicted nucleotidyltransferase
MFDLVHIQDALEEIVRAPVNLITRGEIHPALKDRILSEAIDAWP